MAKSKVIALSRSGTGRVITDGCVVHSPRCDKDQAMLSYEHKKGRSLSQTLLDQLVKADAADKTKTMEFLVFSLFCRGTICICSLSSAYVLLENWKLAKDHQGDQELVYRYLQKYVKARWPRNL